jgi:hypothetical protein
MPFLLQYPQLEIDASLVLINHPPSSSHLSYISSSPPINYPISTSFSLHLFQSKINASTRRRVPPQIPIYSQNVMMFRRFVFVENLGLEQCGNLVK